MGMKKKIMIIIVSLILSITTAASASIIERTWKFQDKNGQTISCKGFNTVDRTAGIYATARTLSSVPLDMIQVDTHLGVLSGNDEYSGDSRAVNTAYNSKAVAVKTRTFQTDWYYITSSATTTHKCLKDGKYVQGTTINWY
jgi:hypothetical protein